MRGLLKNLIVVLVLILVPALAANGADQSTSNVKTQTIEPMVVTATLQEQKLSQTPATVQVIDHAQIQQMGATSLAEALGEAVGMVLSTESGRVVRPSIRGTGVQHTVVLIDGRRMAPGFRGLNDINQIPTVLIDRIEIVRGPSSALYGSDALGGVINIITKKAPKEGVVAGVDVKAGTNIEGGGELLMPQAYGGAGVEPFRFILGANYKSVNGWDYDGEAPDDGDDLEQKNVIGQASVDIGKNHSVSFGGYYNRFNREGLRELSNTLTNRDANDEGSQVFARYDGEFADTFNLMLQAYHAEFEDDVDTTPNSGGSSYLEKYKRTQYEGRFTAKIKGLGSATLGAEFRDDTKSGDDSPDYDTDNTAGFAQVDMMFFDRLNVVAGLRVDDHSEFGSEWSPRVAMSLQINEYLRLKGSYGHGFRAPIPYELYLTSYKRMAKDTYLPNSDLQPETAQSFDLGLQSSLPLAQGLDMELTYFHNEIDDMIEAVLQSKTGSGSSLKNTYMWENITEAETSGLEFLSALKLPYGWKLGAGLTYLSTENKETGEQLASQPEFKGNLNAQWHIASLGLRARLSYTFYTGVEDGSGNSLDDYSILDAYLAKDIYDGLQVYAGMKNMLDEETDDYNIQPAFVYLGVKWDY